MLFFLLINVKMPTVVGILTFMSRKNFMLIIFMISRPVLIFRMAILCASELIMSSLQLLLVPLILVLWNVGSVAKLRVRYYT